MGTWKGWLAVAVCAAGLAPAAEASGLLRPVDAAHGDLEIKEHKVDVVVNNGFAMTKVEQVFYNPHGQDLEAVYTFPVPEQASMSELSLWIDGKEVVGEVLAKKEAREAYEDEKAHGRDAALNEKNGHTEFRVSVSPVRAGRDTRVRLVYYQPLSIDHGIGRYVYPMEEGGVDDVRDTAFFLNDVVTGEATLAINLQLKTSYPVDQVLVPSHPEASIVKGEGGVYSVALSSPGPAALRRDFVFNYRLASSQPASVELIPYKEAGASEGHFMVVVTPGDELHPLAKGADWTFILDVSGSMQDKLSALAEGVEKALGRMRPEDRFRIATFNQRADWLIREYTAASGQNVQKAVSLMQALRADGGTDLYSGLQLGIQGLDGDRTSAVLLVTDGVTNTGIVDPKEFLKLLRGHDIRLFTFVMGNGANTPLLEDLAEVSNGFAMNVSNADAIVGRILQAKSKLTHEAMRDARIAIDGVKTFALTPERPLTLYRGDQLVAFGKYRGDGGAKLTLTAKVAGREVKETVAVKLPASDVRNPEVERLWGLGRIRELEALKRLGGDAKELDGTITEVATKYSLVTDHTSMVVMSDQQLERRGLARSNGLRVLRERAAQQARAAQAPANYISQYSPNPVSRGYAPRLGGGGSIGAWFGLLSMLFAALGGRGPRRKR
ncbi:MAG: VWA domain-containing protein [Elusimicrobia bacterium]|nr:VWA domain-containing protein [Elusimicrobiota bacterium]